MVRALLFSILAAGLVTGMPAQADNKEEIDHLSDVRLGEKVDRVCFRGLIDNFREPTATTVVVERGAKDFLFEMEEECSQLDGAGSISVNNAFSSGTCVTTYDQIIAYRSTFGNDPTAPGNYCRIKSIYEWNEDAAKSEVASLE